MLNPALALAIEIDGDGAHPASWRRAAHAPDELLTPRRAARMATAAENAGFTLITLDDGLLPPGRGQDIGGRIGAIERAAFIAASTSVLGIAPVAPVTYAEPFHVSTQLASLDHISAGRTGWVVTEEDQPESAHAWGRPLVAGSAARARESRDGVHVVRGLWDSWEDDAAIRSVVTSRYLDRGRLHYVDFIGETFSVKGPSIVPRPPQGQIPVFARHGLVPDEQVDAALVAGRTLAEVRDAASGVKTPRTFAEVEVALDTPGTTAADRVAALESHAPWQDRGRLRYIGAATGLVQLLAELSRIVDGVRVHPLVLDEDLPVLSRMVVPDLIERGIAARPLPGTSLRTTLGLSRPISRFAHVSARNAEETR
ncbi:LLM class flavin-dependent oxidoreductase [Streptomyces sp. 3214.6]|uniref:LLM class flavin-dependent oxidoreductase n=1 Tax=Streptomyces sp. 3214.6 TaxID=1882757 RepID=UPI00090CC1EF|nr:LLM class flavin-dependent oxidoreductase [Streptomyces sp. 3214.6]SHH29868.1 Luciferase-like monooxygenase [Streptomyces sp. 3214.6]